MHADADWQAVEGVLTKDMATEGQYLQISKLKHSTTKSLSSGFHLNNKGPKRELKVNNNKKPWLSAQNPNILELRLTGLSRIADTWSHFEKSWHHASHFWGGLLVLAECRSNNSANSQPCSVPFNSRVLSASKVPQCSYPPPWPCHQRPLANCDRVPTSTPADNLRILGGIQPAELRRKWATLSLARRAMEPGLLLHTALTCPPTANAWRLKWRFPFVLAAQHLISSPDNSKHTCGALGGSPMENGVVGQHYETLYFHLRHRASTPPGSPGLTASSPLFHSCLHKWGMASASSCEYGAVEQTVDYVVLQCPIHRPHHGLHGLTVLDDETIEWLLNTWPTI